MLSRSVFRAAAQGCRHPAARTAALVASARIEGRRYVSVYGYTQSKALVYSKYGEPKDVLSLHKHSISAPHGTQVNLRLLTAPMNPADVNQIQGVYPSKPPFQNTLGTAEPSAVGGNEGAFEVISTGAGVKNLTKGDWVIMKRTGQGTWRTHAQLDESQLIRIENKEGLSPLQVGTVSVNPVTAYRMIRDFCEWDWMRAGEEWLIQNGANSGVGRAAIQLGREWGIKTLNVVRQRNTPEETEALKQELKDLGATAVVTEEEMLTGGFRDMVHEFTRQGREPIRLALNCVGGKNATALAKTLAPDSHMVTYGAMSKQPVALPSGLLIFKNLVFDGFWVSKWGDKNPELKENTIKDVLQLTRAGRFKDIPVDEVKWNWDSEGSALAESVQGTLGGYRSGKGVFTFTGGDE
ncbi:Alcohol dehydrogenase superfamily zinc-type [Penicillium macrosclerotiorum]|uniref:Alcohol dehydrogenase superfamily zinc-type n=1 Tax=Penicillium macrosclerotiorum TaxID=303699 RepID=UPI002547B5E5|nr:Alcohol dehydrogenase superfamily zinc-type [Penicillium macrosclerotiorum]KAJ5692041.1 Alcohol dehydrogenase superfamily zinc-type [Penicillium macrosclerotiorum]